MNAKKILSLLLTCCLLAGMIPAALANEPENPSPETKTEQTSPAPESTGKTEESPAEPENSPVVDEPAGDEGKAEEAPAQPSSELEAAPINVEGDGEAKDGTTGGTTGGGETAAVAKIGSNTYATLKGAIEAATGNDAPGTEITLTADASVSEKIAISKDVTIDGAGHTVTGATANAGIYFEITNGIVTVENMTLTKFGDTADTVTGAGVFKIPDTATESSGTPKLIAKNLTINNFNRGAFDIRQGTLTASNCTINCDNGATSKLTKGFVLGYATSSKVEATITGCTISGSNSTYEGWSANGIEISCGATAKVTDCKIDSMKGGISLARNYGSGKADVTVSGTTINAKDYALRIFESNSSSSAVKDSSADLKVDSGSYTGDVRISLKDNTQSDGSSKITITGGTYSVDPSQYLDGRYVAEMKDGDYTVRERTLSASVDNRGYNVISATPFKAVSGKENTYECDVTGNVDMRKYAVLDEILQTDFENLLVDTNPRVSKALMTASELNAKYVKSGLDLIFADIDFGGDLVQKDADHHYYIRQENPGMLYAYGPADPKSARSGIVDLDPSDGVKVSVSAGTAEKFTDGLTFILADPSKTDAVGNCAAGDIVIQIAPCEASPATAPTENVTTFIIHNKLTFNPSNPEEDPKTEVSVETKVDTTTGTAAAEVADTAISEDALKAAAAADDKTLTIDAGSTNAASNVKAAEVTLKKEVVTKLAGEDAANVTTQIKTPLGDVSLPAAAMDTIKTNATNTDIKLTVGKVENPTSTEAAFTVEVKTTDGTPVTVKDLETTPLTLSFKVGENRDDNPVLYYVAADGKLTLLENQAYDRTTGMVSATTPHLSTFGMTPTYTMTKEGMGAKIVLESTKANQHLTVQISPKDGTANTIYTVPTGADKKAYIYVTAGTVVNVWETTTVPQFENNSAVPKGVVTIRIEDLAATPND